MQKNRPERYTVLFFVPLYTEYKIREDYDKSSNISDAT